MVLSLKSIDALYSYGQFLLNKAIPVQSVFIYFHVTNIQLEVIYFATIE